MIDFPGRQSPVLLSSITKKLKKNPPKKCENTPQNTKAPHPKRGKHLPKNAKK